MIDTVSILEKRLAEYVGRGYCICTGSGTMALTILLKSLGLPRDSEVIIPSICCQAVSLAVAYAGLTPLFCDVNIYDYNINIASVADVITSKTKVIIAVHLFGYPSQVDDLMRYAKENSIIVIEDAAQAFGGSYKNRKLGGLGDFSITSFGFAKPIDVGGGGAIFTDDYALAKVIREINLGFETYSDISAECAHKLLQWTWRLETREDTMSKMARHFSPYLYRLRSFRSMKQQWAEKTIAAMDIIDNWTMIRKRNARLYSQLITSKSVLHPRYEGEDGTCFRYSILLKHDQKRKVVSELNKRGVWVSTLYPALHRLYQQSGDHCKHRRDNSNYVESHIINLGVAPSYGEERIRRIAEMINEVA